MFTRYNKSVLHRTKSFPSASSEDSGYNYIYEMAEQQYSGIGRGGQLLKMFVAQTPPSGRNSPAIGGTPMLDGPERQASLPRHQGNTPESTESDAAPDETRHRRRRGRSCEFITHVAFIKYTMSLLHTKPFSQELSSVVYSWYRLS